MAIGDKRDADSWEETEFGLGSGMIDPVSRSERTLSAEDQLKEIYARPRTFGGSHLGLPGGERPDLEVTPVPRLLPGEEESDRE